MAVNDFRSSIISGMYASLATVAIFFAEKMKLKISEVKAPSKIAEYISVESPVVKPDQSYVHVIIDTSENGAPMAGAFEWGSGIHGKDSQKYPITPKDIIRGFLAIPAERWPNKLYDDDPAILKYVLHPGVAARPYIKPTIEDNKEEIRKMLAADFKASILGSIQKVTVIK